MLVQGACNMFTMFVQDFAMLVQCFCKMSLNLIPTKTPTGLRMATTPKTLKALEVREDSMVESLADPKLEPPIDPRVKPMMVQARTKADP